MAIGQDLQFISILVNLWQVSEIEFEVLKISLNGHYGLGSLSEEGLEARTKMYEISFVIEVEYAAQ